MPRVPAKLDQEGLYERAVRALARRGRSEAEVRRLLTPRAATAGDIEPVMLRLRDHGYLDDTRLAGHAAAYEKDVRRHGRARALRDLRARGVDGELAAQAVAQSYEGTDEMEMLRAYLRRKRLRRPEELRQAGNLYRKLMVAGFSPGACLRCLREWKLDPEWLEALEEQSL